MRPVITPSPKGGHGEVTLNISAPSPPLPPTADPTHPHVREAWSHTTSTHAILNPGPMLTLKGSLRRKELPNYTAPLEVDRRERDRSVLGKQLARNSARGGSRPLYWIPEAAVSMPSYEEMGPAGRSTVH